MQDARFIVPTLTFDEDESKPKLGGWGVGWVWGGGGSMLTRRRAMLVVLVILAD